MAADGSGAAELLLAGNDLAPMAWSPDGRTLLYYQLEADRNYHIWVLSLDAGGERKSRRLLKSSDDQLGAVFSPDGHWLAYLSNQTGHYEVYVRPFPGPGEQTVVSAEGGFSPQWTGKEIFFGTGPGTLASVEIQGSPALRVSAPRVVYRPVHQGNFTVAPDGKRVLLLETPETPGEDDKLDVVAGWFEELRQRVPIARR